MKAGFCPAFFCLYPRFVSRLYTPLQTLPAAFLLFLYPESRRSKTTYPLFLKEEKRMALCAFSPEASLDELLTLAEKKFKIGFESVRVGDQTLEIAQITNMVEYLDRLSQKARNGKNIQIPMWAKIWPAATLLSYSVRQLPCTGEQSLLEIGAGMGIPGLFAAAMGFQTVISDINEDALLFARINILKNGLADRARIQRIDFSTAPTEQKFDVLLGSEVLYIPGAAKPLVHFVKNSMKPEGMALLARDYKRHENTFLTEAAPIFDIASKTIGCKEDNSKTKGSKFLSTIYRLTPKKQKS